MSCSPWQVLGILIKQPLPRFPSKEWQQPILCACSLFPSSFRKMPDALYLKKCLVQLDTVLIPSLAGVIPPCKNTSKIQPYCKCCFVYISKLHLKKFCLYLCPYINGGFPFPFLSFLIKEKKGNRKSFWILLSYVIYFVLKIILESMYHYSSGPTRQGFKM